MRAQALEIQSLIDPIPQPLPPSRAELAAAERAASLEVFKDHWNEEVSKAVRWVQNTDWDDVREGIEQRASRLWPGSLGETPSESLGAAKDAVSQQAQAQAGSIKDAARGAWGSAKATGRSVEEAAQSKALEARLRIKKEVSKVGEEVKEKTEEAKGGFFSFLSRGKEKAGELVTAAKSAIGAAEGAANAIDGQTITTGMTSVQKALHQRYAKSQSQDTRTIAEVLSERYVRVDARDNTQLRGL